MYLAGQIAEHYGQELGDIVLNKFSDGEMQAEIKESVRGTFSFFIQSTNAPADNIMELLLMIDAAKRASADYITAVIPYFGYARQDRKDKARVPISAKLIANLLQAAGVNRIMTMDLHADQIQGFLIFLSTTSNRRRSSCLIWSRWVLTMSHLHVRMSGG